MALAGASRGHRRNSSAPLDLKGKLLGCGRTTPNPSHAPPWLLLLDASTEGNTTSIFLMATAFPSAFRRPCASPRGAITSWKSTPVHNCSPTPGAIRQPSRPVRGAGGAVPGTRSRIPQTCVSHIKLRLVRDGMEHKELPRQRRKYFFVTTHSIPMDGCICEMGEGAGSRTRACSQHRTCPFWLRVLTALLKVTGSGS